MKNKTSHLSGSLTVFFTLLFSSILIFLLALWAFGRDRLMRSGLAQDVEAAAENVMAEYEPSWTQEYGLYMVPASRLESSCRFYLEENSTHAYGRYDVTDLACIPCGTLADPDILEQEICSFMNERAVLDSLQEIVSMLEELKGQEKVQEELKQYEDSAELYEIQTLYGRLVTDLEGVAQDGSEEDYAINHFFQGEVTLDNVLMAAQSSIPSSQDLDLLESARREMSVVKTLLMDARETAGMLADAIEALEEKHAEAEETEEGGTSLVCQIPVTPEELREDEKVWEENEKLLEEAEEPMDEIISLLGVTADPQTPEGADIIRRRQDAIKYLQALMDFRTDISLPYEYRERRGGLSLTSLWNYLKGYSVEVSDLAPDEDVDLHLDRTYEEEDEGSDFFAFEDLSLDDLSARYETVEYCLGVFRNFSETAAQQKGQTPKNLRGDAKKVHVLRNEIEYLLCGRNNEYRNVDGTRRRMVALRMVLNAAYLLTHADKRAEIEAAAAMTGGILLPGIGNAIAYGLILTTWSLAESTQDMRILYQAGKVPLLKTEESWQTSLTSLASDILEDPDVTETKGLTYRQYLRILLYFMDRDTLLYRIQDLLTMNHQDFPLDEAVVRFSVSGTADTSTQGIYFTGRDFRFQGEYGYVQP